MYALDKNLPVPLYHQLKNILMTGIESGEWQLDQQIPTEEDLSKRFGISKITVRQELRELAGLGYIRREQGRGTFVSRPQLSQGPRELTSFTEEMRRHNLTAHSRVLDQIYPRSRGSGGGIANCDGRSGFRPDAASSRQR